MREFWSATEVISLRENFPIKTKQEIECMFSNRTYCSIYKKAKKMGLQRGKEKERETRVEAGKSKGRRVYRKKNKKGYVLVYKPEHHRADMNGFVAEHIVVAEEKYGKIITPLQAVHHINGDKSDNRPENIMLFETQGEHTSFHNTGRSHNEETKEKISRKAIERLKDPRNHPSHKNIDILQMMKEINDGVPVSKVCENYGICKSTYYKRIKKGDF